MDSTSVNLLRRLRDPTEESAWERFVELYTPVMFHWAKQRGLAFADASDLVQDVLLTLVQKIREYNPDAPGRFRGWLRTITVNRATDFQRQNKLQPKTDGGTQLRTVADVRDDAFWQETEYRRQLLARAVQLLRTSFAASTWEAGQAQIVEGRSASDVAARLGISINAAYIAKSRVLERLRIELEGLLD